MKKECCLETCFGQETDVPKHHGTCARTHSRNTECETPRSEVALFSMHMRRVQKCIAISLAEGFASPETACLSEDRACVHRSVALNVEARSKSSLLRRSVDKVANKESASVMSFLIPRGPLVLELSEKFVSFTTGSVAERSMNTTLAASTAPWQMDFLCKYSSADAT